MKLRHVLPVTIAGYLWFGMQHDLPAAPVSKSHPQAAGKTQVLAEFSNQNNASAVPASLMTYQVAMDQIAAGRFLEARVLLEENIRRHGNRPEINLLLGYLLQREGRLQEARNRLAAVAPTSPLASAYAGQLSNSNSASQPLARPNMNTQTASTVAGANKPLTSLSQTDARLLRLEQTLAGLVNAERTKAGLQTLAYDARLSDVARAHSAEMRDLKYFAHQSPTPSLSQPLDRFKAVFGVTPAIVAENVYRAWGTQHQLSDNDARAAHTALMNSPGHRENIMFPGVTRIGIGIVANGTGDIWITQMFNKP